jgi:DNA-binding NtrC family response regulator
MAGLFETNANVATFTRPLNAAGTHDCSPEELIGNSLQIQSIRETIDRLARNHVTVVITGETGTGKELVARRLHRTSCPRNAPFLPLNCAAIPDALMESELFGFEKGAFTGADRRTDGILIKATGGTLFLDEIGDLSSSAQAKFLRVLDDREVRRLGSTTTQPVDVRFIAATNRSLESLVQEHRFRDDLLFRLSVVNIHIPPLRERPADIPPIAKHFLLNLAERYHCPEVLLTSDAVVHLQRQVWAGNVRELRNVLERTFALRTSDQIGRNDLFITQVSPLDGTLLSKRQSRVDSRMLVARSREAHIRSIHNDDTLAKLSEMERLRQTLEATSWNKSKTAEILSCSRMTVYRKISKHDLARQPAGVRAAPLAPE